MSQTESCNSRHFSWLMKSCFPNPNDTQNAIAPIPIQPTTTTTINSTNCTHISSLPDDLLAECLSRVPSSSLPSLSFVCRRWSHVLHSPSFFSLRRLRHFLQPTLFTFSSDGSSSVLFTASFQFQHFINSLGQWKVVSFPLLDRRYQLSHARLSAIGPRIYIIGRDGMLCYDTWSSAISVRSSMVFPRKKFACAVVSSKIYVAGGAHSAAAAVEEYDPERDRWRVVARAPRRRFGCIGAAVDGVFYVIGGLKIGGPAGPAENQLSRAAMPGAEYASSMDLYDVEAGCWLRSRTVPGGGCVVSACAAGGYVYILASHAVELSFWRFDARRLQGRSGGGGFGEWCRINSPPLPPQVRLDSTVRFGCVGVEDKVLLIQVNGCIDDLLRRSGRRGKGMKQGLVLVYDSGGGEWRRGPNLPEVIQRAACVAVEC